MTDLFEPIDINGLKLNNRFVRSATWTGLADVDGAVTDRLITLMTGLAQGGVGLIVTGHAFVHVAGRHAPWQLAVDNDRHLPGLGKMVRVVHDHGGRIALQLGYGGAYLARSRVAGLSDDDLKAIIGAFAQAANRAKLAGFDAVEIFAAHGFLLSQFLCPRYNPRTDRYGGSIENRARLLLETVREVRRTVGSGYPVIVKLNAADFVENGITLEESLAVGNWLEKDGINALELSGGLLNAAGRMNRSGDPEKDEAWFRKEALAFKAEISLPLILVGGIRSFETAADLTAEGAADLIAMSRPFIREPGLVRRWESGDRSPALCLSCNNCFEPIKRGEGVACNPRREKPETFFTQSVECVPAEASLPAGTEYLVSAGLEELDGTFLPVIRVEMLVNKKPAGRPPCFDPEGIGLQRVVQAAARLAGNLK